MIEEDDIQTLINNILLEKDEFLRIYTLDLLKDHSQRNLAIPALLELLSDESVDIQVKAVEVLGKIRTASSQEGLIKALSSRNAAVRKAAIRALGEQENFNIVPKLVPLLFDSNWEVRNEAAIVLDYYKWKPSSLEEKTAYLIAKEKWNDIILEKEISAPILITFAQDEEPEIRRNVIKIIGERKIDTPEAPKVLFKILSDDESYDIRETAARALCKIGTLASFQFLENAAKSDFWFSRKCVASSVRFMQDYKQALKLLKSLIKDENLYVRKAAKESTKELLEKIRREKH